MLYIPVLLKSAICARKSAHLVANASIILRMRRNIAAESKQGEDNRDDRGTPLPKSRRVSHWLGNGRRCPLQRSDPLRCPLHGCVRVRMKRIASRTVSSARSVRAAHRPPHTKKFGNTFCRHGIYNAL